MIYWYLETYWFDLKFHTKNPQLIKRPHELEKYLRDPPAEFNNDIVNRIQGSMIGIALGDALGAHVEFKPRKFLLEHPVHDLQSGGTWGLQKGQVNLQRIQEIFC